MINAVTVRFGALGRALNWTRREHLTSAPTVERDLRKRPSAQRFPGGLLTRKRSQVQTLSRPPLFSLVSAPSAPADSAPDIPRPRCGRSLLPAEPGGPPEPDDGGSPPAQRPHRVVTTFRSSPRSGISRQLAQGAPAGTGSICSLPPPPPTDRHLALDQLPWSASGERGAAACTHAKRRTRSAVDPRASHARPTFDHPVPARPDSSSDDQAAHRPQRYVQPGTPSVAGPAHRRLLGSSAVRTARLQWPRTPDACLSGHPDHTGRVDTGRLDTGRPPDQLDGRWSAWRTADADRATNGVAGVRTSWTATTTATADGAAQPGSGYSACGARQPMTARG
jgi:hypothetical protein